MAAYCSVAYFLANGCPPDVASLTNRTEQENELEAASRELDAYIGQVVTLPLTTVGPILPSRTAEIAGYKLAVKKNLAADTQSGLYVLYKNALSWASTLDKRAADAAGIVGSVEDPTATIRPDLASSSNDMGVDF